MMDIVEWSKSFNVNEKTWLMLGKGPSFSKVFNIKLSDYFVCTLNHSIREVKADLAHLIDIEVFRDCGEVIYENAKFVVMPYKPHVKCDRCDKTVFDYVDEFPLLKKMDQEGRLVWYNLSSSEPYKESPVIEAKFFSAEAVLNILATCGVKTVRSLGVDGGSSYSQKFDDLNDKTLLVNTHSSFDKQFEGIAKTILNTGIFYAPLHVQAPIRVFVGTDIAQMAGVKVLEYSIKKYASMSVEVIPIDDRDVPVPKDPENRSKTGFSFSRLHIPKLCEYKGKAIYVDADMQVFTDIAKLWNAPFEGANVLYSEQPSEKGRIPQYSVMLLNCEKLDWDVTDIVKGFDECKYNYRDVMYHLCLVPPSKKKPLLPFEWNSLEHFEKNKTCLIHYTDMPTQPWVSHDNKNGKIWYDCLREAVDEGFISEEYLHEEIRSGHVSPDLPRWIGLSDPDDYESLKKQWIPPYKRFTKVGSKVKNQIEKRIRGIDYEIRPNPKFVIGIKALLKKIPGLQKVKRMVFK